jgi:RNA polymerase sigma-70 factor (ECF subfamily)
MNNQEPSIEIDLDTISLLVPKAKQGSGVARAELLAHVQGYASLMARQHLKPNLQAKVGVSDVVQQSMAQIIQGFDGFRGTTKAEFYGWMGQIVKNEVRRLQRDYHRDRRNIDREQRLGTNLSEDSPGYVPADQQKTPRSQVIANERQQLFERAMEHLPDDYRRVIQLRSLERLSFKEVAAAMDRSHDSVTKLWYRAIMKLQQELEGYDDSQEIKK